MVREALNEQERTRGRALGVALRRSRGHMTVRDLALRSGLAQETIRKIERGAVPTPALFTVAALAAALEVPLADLVHEAVASSATVSHVEVA
jgi:transcriptional regulator with XRE-family HTH domain